MKLTQLIGRQNNLGETCRSAIRVTVALVLAVAAALKWRSFAGETSSQSFAEIAPQLEWGAIQAELLVAAWLLSGWLPIASLFVTTCLFSFFLGISLLMTVQGRSSCGCLGSIPMNPAWVLLFDVAMVTLLLISLSLRPSGAQGICKITSISRRYSMIWIAGFALLGIGVFQNSISISTFLSDWVPASVSGQYLITNPAVADAGPGYANEWKRVTFKILNRTNRSIELLGAARQCQCKPAQPLPVTVPAFGNVQIAMDVRLGQSAGVQFGGLRLMTSERRQALLICRWRGVVKVKNHLSSGIPQDHSTPRVPICSLRWFFCFVDVTLSFAWRICNEML